MSDFAERALEPFEIGSIAREPEAQEIVGPIEAADPDLPAGEFVMPKLRVFDPHEAIERGAADERHPRLREHEIEGCGLTRELAARQILPIPILQRLPPDGERLPAHRPRPERAGDALPDILARDGKAEAQSREAEEFAEGAQDHDGMLHAELRGGVLWAGVHKGFVDDEPAAAILHLAGERLERIARENPAIGVVGIDDDEMARLTRYGIERRWLASPPSLRAEGEGVLGIGRPQNRDIAFRGEVGQPLDQRLRARCCDDGAVGGHPVSDTRGFYQCVAMRLLGEAGDEIVGGRGVGISRRIDARGEVEPIIARASKMGFRLGKITAMLHERVVARISGGFQRAALASALLLVAAPALAEAPRIVSINMCTDQLLLAIADPEQIIGLSPFAQDAERSWAAGRAMDHPVLSGTAEEVLYLKPDIVMAGRFTRRATRNLLRAKGFQVEEFDPVRNIAESREQIRRVGVLTGHQKRAEAHIAALDAAIESVRASASKRDLRILPLQRRGWVSGGETLITELLGLTGLSNAASELGLKSGGQVSLEAIVKLRPDALLISRDDITAEDQGRAMLHHPAIHAMFPPERRLVIPQSLTVCGGPMLAEALERLAVEIEKLPQ
jgi:iron complex transport system substrate-binding protein